jgi:AcrR family transcriptional regulator
MELTARKGLNGLRMAEISKRAGVSVGGVYHHFDNKESLARHIHERTLEEFTQRLTNRVSGCESTQAKLHGYAELVFEIAEEDPAMIEYMLLMRHGEFLRDIPPVCEARPFQWVQQVLSAGMDRGEILRTDPLLAAAAFTGVILRMVQLKLENVAPVSLSSVLDEVFAHAWAAVANHR